MFETMNGLEQLQLVEFVLLLVRTVKFPVHAWQTLAEEQRMQYVMLEQLRHELEPPGEY